MWLGSSVACKNKDSSKLGKITKNLNFSCFTWTWFWHFSGYSWKFKHLILHSATYWIVMNVVFACKSSLVPKYINNLQLNFKFLFELRKNGKNVCPVRDSVSRTGHFRVSDASKGIRLKQSLHSLYSSYGYSKRGIKIWSLCLNSCQAY